MTPTYSRTPVVTTLSILAAIGFAVAHTQSPLYYSNQNQYFLHGLAHGGYGDLGSDWLANTADPTPVFSAGIEWAYQGIGEWPFHVVFFLLLIVYFLSLWGIAGTLSYFPRSIAGQALFCTAMIVLHAGIVRAASVMAFGVDYPWYFQAGIANQYILGAGLQPSVFGVLLLTSLAAYVRGCPILAGVLAATACVVHSTYLLHAGILVFCMMVMLCKANRIRTAARMGVVALAIVAPVLVYVASVFGGSGPKVFASSQHILATVRIPHHTEVSIWLDLIACLQLVGVLLGLTLLRRSSLIPVLGLAGFIAVLLSAVQFITGNVTLSLLFPWRMSAVLVPLASAVVLLYIANVVEQVIPRVVAWLLSITLSLGAVAGAFVVYDRELGYQSNAAEDGLLDFVAGTHQPGELYLLPTGFPRPSTKRGSSSSTFVPAKQGGPKIFELQRFRLATGAAVYIDFKSIPYQDVEVLEWYARVSRVEQLYKQADWNQPEIVDWLRGQQITHVVVPVGVTLHSTHWNEIFHQNGYTVYRLAW